MFVICQSGVQRNRERWIPTETVQIARDPDDNRLIEAALTGEAQAIVTGDQDLLTLQNVGRSAS